MKIKINYTPNARQAVFHACNADEVVYGGARGGGKSCALVMEALAYALENAGAVIYLFRETYDDLEASLIREWREKAPKELYTFHETKHLARMANGSEIYFRHVASEADAYGYQGRSIDFIGIDELTKHSERTVQVLLACLRSPKGFRPVFKGTCNPGGVGHTWVKERYIDPTEHGKVVITEPVTGSRIAFVAALVYDNDVIMKGDPSYVKRLENLPENEKKAYLYGDWDIFEGQYFAEWSYDLHVCEPFVIPSYWRRYCALDYGLDMLAAYWAAFDPQGRGVVYRELYESGLIISEAAKRIKSLSAGEEIVQFLAPPDLQGRQRETGRTTLELFSENKVFLTVVDANRVAGWYNLKEWLAPVSSEDGGITSRLRVFSNCKNLIRTLPMLQRDVQNPNDCACEPHEVTHAPDAIRYLLSGWPARAQEPKSEQQKLPFALQDENENLKGDLLTWN